MDTNLYNSNFKDKCITILLGGGTNICPYWFPPSPFLSPASAKVSCQRANKLENTFV